MVKITHSTFKNMAMYTALFDALMEILQHISLIILNHDQHKYYYQTVYH